MRFVWKFLFLSLFLLFVGFLIPNLDSNKVLAACTNSTSSNAYCDVIIAKFTNSSGNTLNIFYRFLASDTGCTTGPVNSPPISVSCVDLSQGDQSIWSLVNGSFATRTYDQDTSVFGHHYNEYYVWWWATYAATGATCVDPVVQTEGGASFVVPGANEYRANITVTCDFQPPPPVSVTPASGLDARTSCESSTSVRTSFSWTPATASGTTIDEQWLDFSIYPPPNSFNPGGFQNRNVTGASSFAEGGFAPNVTYYWRINTHATNGQWYPSTTVSFTTPNCRSVVGLSVSSSCPSGLEVTFRWSRPFPDDPLTLQVADNSSFSSNLHAIDVRGPEEFRWSATRTMSGSYAPVENHRYYWRLVDSVGATNPPSSQSPFTTTSCAGPPPGPEPSPVPVPNCSDVPYNVTLSWKNSGSNWFVDISTRSDFATFSNKNVSNVTQTSAPSGFSPTLTLQPNTTYYWRIFDGTRHVLGQPWSVPTCPPPDCTTGTTGVIMGYKWSLTDNKNFDTANGLPGATVTISGAGVSYSFGPGSNPYSKSVPAVAAPGTTYSVSSSGVSGWRVHAEVERIGSPTIVYATSAVGAGTSIGVTIVCGQEVNVRFFYESGSPPPPPDKLSPCPPKGDLNRDGVINQKDIDLFTFTSPLEVADLDGNGAVTIFDAALLGRYINGLISTFPVCSSVPPPINNTLQVRSTLGGSSTTGVSIAHTGWGTPGTGGTTNYDFTSSGDIDSALRAPATFNGANFVSWSGCDDNNFGLRECRATLSGNATQTVTANYAATVSGISLTGTTDCLDGVNARVHLTWTATTGDTQFNIIRNGAHITSVTGTRWDSGPETQGARITWNVMGMASSTISNSVTLRTATCGATPPPTTLPGFPDLTADIRVVSVASGRVVNTTTRPAAAGEQLKAVLEASEGNGTSVGSFSAYFWQQRVSEPPACSTSGATRTYTGIRTNPPPENESAVLIGEYLFNAPAIDGIYESFLYVDGNCRITETSELNNIDSGRFRVGPPPQPDLQVTSVEFYESSDYDEDDRTQSFKSGDQIYVRVRYQNNGGDINGPFKINFYWQLGLPPNDSCVGNPPPDAQTIISTFTAGRRTSWEFNLPAPNGSGSLAAYAFADGECVIAESIETNNIWSATYNLAGAGAWFETTGGDVGSRGQLKVGQTPPANHYQSSYLLAASSVDPNVRVHRWKLSPYGKKLIPEGRVYDYFASRFLTRAQANGGHCTISAGVSGLVYCNGDVNYEGGAAPNGNSVWFINGNLAIKQNLALGAGDTAVFVVSGNITVETDVTRADGVYVSGNTFSDATVGSSQGRQLVINGAIYASKLNLPRVLGGASCSSGPACDNSQTAALLVNFEPKYLVQMNNLLGSPSLSWTEVEP